MPPPLRLARAPLSSLPARTQWRRLASAAASGPNPVAASASSSHFQVFNRNTKRLQRDRSAANANASRRVDYLREKVADRLVERLMYIKRTFPTVLDLGAGACHIAHALTRYKPSPEEAQTVNPTEKKIERLICTDLSHTLLHRDADIPPFSEPTHPLLPTIERQVLDEEHIATHFPPNHFSAVVSSLSLHWINNLPFLLQQVNSLLAPDAPFVAAMMGGDSLYELRTSLQLAEMERMGGVSPRVSPLADVKDIGGLLQGAGLKMLTVDVDDIIVTYPDMFALMLDLQQMGEGNAVLGREMGAVSREILMAAEGIYQELHGELPEAGSTESEGEAAQKKVLPATFRIIYMIGWKEGPNQPKPLKRGSGEINIKDILESGGKK
ncbi:S-adenosyl-L-methionine-dependent methyltransferase [Kalaharituber pfeilii]|nr:S-adenosyl-L-methionine-dependent methyltransferase [Kalaharituber pfeilii]